MVHSKGSHMFEIPQTRRIPSQNRPKSPAPPKKREYSPRRCEYTLPLGNLGAESYFMMPRACLVPLSRVCGRIIKITISTPTAERSQESGPLPAHFVRPPDLLSSDSCRKWAGSASNQLTSGSLLGRPYFGSLWPTTGPLWPTSAHFCAIPRVC